MDQQGKFMRNAAIDALSDDLIARLRQALPDQLSALADVLTDSGKGRLSMGSAVRELFVKAKELGTFTDGTRELLVAELLAYGGSALANLKRGKGIPYAELLVDTISYLGGHVDKDRDIDAMEVEVIRRELEILWDSGRSGLKSAIANALRVEAKWRAVEDALREPHVQLAAAEFLCTSDMDFDLIHEGAQRHGDSLTKKVGALGGTLGSFIKSNLGEAVSGKLASLVSSHRVTLPCINHLARIRLATESLPKEPRKDPDPKTRRESAEFPIEGSFLVVEGEGGSAALSITELEGSAIPTGAIRLDARKAGVNRWSSLFQAVPAAAAANEVAGERYMKVLVNGPLAAAKDGNGFRGFVKGGPHSQISEHARLFEGDLSQIVNAGALFNLASFAVGQKHMADISAHLENIQEGVDRIAQFQQRGRESGIRGAIRYLQQVGPLIMDGDHTPAQFQKLEDCEAELLNLQEHLAIDLSGLIDEAIRTEADATFGVSSAKDRLAGLQSTFDELGHQWVLCIKARMVACRLLCSFEGTARTVATREEAIRKDLAWFAAADGVVTRFAEAVNKRAGTFRSLTESAVELQAHRELLKVMQMATLPALESEATGAAAGFSQLLQESRAPVELVIAVAQGEVREVAVL